MNWTKRAFIQTAAAASAQVCFGPATLQAKSPSEQSLRQIGQNSGILYGLSESSNRYGQNREYFEKLASECSLFSPGNDFNWRAVEKKQSLYSFGQLDIMANYCRAHQLQIIGHTLAWYHTVPDWAKSSNSETFRQAFLRYLGTTIERFSDIAVRFDVVNEPIDPKSDRPDGLRKSDFLLKLGPDYIADAFVAARKAAAGAKLCLNEYGIETGDEDSVRKRQLFLELIRSLHARKVPIDLIGLQSHLDGMKPIDAPGLSAFLREIKSLGYRVVISELDVNDVLLPGDIAQRDAMVAQRVDEYLACVFAETRPTAIVNWGFSDRYTWLSVFHKRADGLPLRPLAFDDNIDRKQVWATLKNYIGKQ